MKTIGLVGGTSWVSTLDYYRGIHESVMHRAGGDHFPTCLVYSLDFGAFKSHLMRQDWDALLESLACAARHLQRSGAEALVLCSNTSHIVAGRLKSELQVPLIDITEATTRALRTSGLTRVAFLGTRFTMEADFFADALERAGIQMLVPEAADRAFVNESIFSELTRGVFNRDTRKRYLDIMASLAMKGAQGVILGCTEIPLLIKQEDSALPLFDTTALHVESAVDFILS